MAAPQLYSYKAESSRLSRGYDDSINSGSSLVLFTILSPSQSIKDSQAEYEVVVAAAKLCRQLKETQKYL